MRIPRARRHWLATVVFGIAAFSNVFADTGAAPPGKALVYVIQGETQNFANLLVSVNGRRLESLPKNSYVAFVAEPGTHEISTAAGGRAATPLTVAADTVYYLSQRVSADGMPTHRVLSQAEGRALLNTYRAVRTEALTIGAPASSSQPVSTASVASAAPATPSPRRGNFALTAKAGDYTLSEGTQRWLGFSTQVKTKASSVFAVGGEYELENGFAIAPEILLFKTTWTQSNGAVGSFNATVVTLNGKMYLASGDTFRPFIGAGVGAAATSFSGDITGNSGGAAFQLFAGAELRFNQVGLYLEYKTVSAETEDDNSNVIDVSGKGAFAGIGIRF